MTAACTIRTILSATMASAVLAVAALVASGARAQDASAPELMPGIVMDALPAASAGATGETAAGRRPQAILVLDSTAGMRPLFGSETKLLAVSNAITNVMPPYDGKLDMGLLVFGHRSSGDGTCGALYEARPLSALDSAAIGEVLPTLKAKGPAAVSLAVESAASGAGMADVRGSIVVVTGGPEECQQDPCAVAAAIKAKGLHQVHVVAVDAGEGKDLDSLRCLAAETGGSYRRVTSPLELAAALDEAFVLAAARLPTRPETTPAAEAGGATFGEDDAATALLRETVAGGSGAGGVQIVNNGSVPVRLSALLTDSGPQLVTDLTWRVYDPGKPGSAGPVLLASSQEAVPDLRLPAGEFLVNVAYGKANVTRPLTVTGAPVTEPFILNAGGLRFIAVGADGAMLPPDQVECDIFSDERDRTGERIRVIAGARPGSILRLNAGIYYVASVQGDANAVIMAEVGVEAGKLTEATLTHTGARTTFKFVTQRGGEALADTRWTIVAADGTVVKESVGALPAHVLAPGKYTVQARRGDDASSQTFEVSAGRSRQVEVVLKKGG